MEIKTNNRLDPKEGMEIRFGVVVTLKEINGINRIDEFIKNCTLNVWLVNITPAVKYRRFYLLKFPSATLSSIVAALATTHSSALQMKIYSS